MGMKANSRNFKGTAGNLKYQLDIQRFAKMPYCKRAVTPIEKFNDYSLNYNNPNAKGKAEAYEKGLGYTRENSDGLVKQIHSSVTSGKIEPYTVAKSQYGTKYKFKIPVKGVNGKTKKVCVVYQIDKGKRTPRLITNYLEAKK